MQNKLRYNGGELFGDQTIVNGVKAADGFAALSAEEEVNCEAKETTLWCTNADGIGQADELQTLSELNITSNNLTTTTSNNQNYTNQRRAA